MPIPPKLIAIMQTPWPLFGAWLIGGIITIIVPLSKWKKERNNFYNYAGQYIEYENNQRAYEEAQNGDNNNNNNYQYWECKWYQFKCRQNRYRYQYANEDGGGDRVQQRLPDWYASLGGSYEEERREREEMRDSADEASGAVKFVYTFTLLMFLGLLIYGAFVIVKKRQPATLISTMAVFGLCAFMQMILLPQGVISTEGREMEDSIYGWYGQLAVLMVYSNWGYFLFSLIASFVIGIKAFLDHRFLGAEKPTQQNDAAISSKELADEPASSEYKSMA